VNVNLRPYYAEGSKTMGFEIVEQLGWRVPRHTVVPMASGSLLTKVAKSYQEAIKVGLIDEQPFAVHGAQATGCSPISTAFKAGTDLIRPVPKPKTIAKSLAIGTPADGYYAVNVMKSTGGSCDDASDEEIIEGIKLLAETEGIFAETAGGVTVACAKKLIASGKIPANESAVLCITGHGLKTAEAVAPHLPAAPPDQPEPARIRCAHRERCHPCRAPRADPSQRPGRPVRQHPLPGYAQILRSDLQHEPQGPLRRQRPHGKLLGHAQGRTGRRMQLPHPRAGPPGHL
jgi:threonine synthase